MDSSSNDVVEVLTSKGVTEIHHANSVVAACHFLRHGSLLSRGLVEKRGLRQTAQYTDDLDKRYGIWSDVFADTVDIHRRASKANLYGPVLFVFDAKVIQSGGAGIVRVTKLNPTKWDGKPEEERWFRDRAELGAGLVVGNFDQMLVFRTPGGELPFAGHLRRLVVDDPVAATSDGADLHAMAVGALKRAMGAGGLDVPIERRKCGDNCSCRADYAQCVERTCQMFVPGD